MLRSIVAVTILLLAFFHGTSVLATNTTGERSLSSDDFTPAPEISENLFLSESTVPLQDRYALKPNIRLTEKDDLKSLCFSPVDTVVHYIGANIGEEERGSENETVETLPTEPFNEGDGWSVKLGAGVERQLSKRAAFDLDYRYTSSPLELDLDALQPPSGHEHYFSAGMTFSF